MKINVVMLKDATGCDDGIHSKAYKKGEAYTIGGSLFRSFEKMGWAKRQEKSPVTENKAVVPVKEDKSDKKVKNAKV